MDEDFITLEVEEEGCGRLQFELPLDITEAKRSRTSRAWCREPSRACSNSSIQIRAKLCSAAPPCWCTNCSGDGPPPVPHIKDGATMS